jgi:hypothetical protein
MFFETRNIDGLLGGRKGCPPKLSWFENLLEQVPNAPSHPG